MILNVPSNPNHSMILLKNVSFLCQGVMMSTSSSCQLSVECFLFLLWGGIFQTGSYRKRKVRHYYFFFNCLPVFNGYSVAQWVISLLNRSFSFWAWIQGYLLWKKFPPERRQNSIQLKNLFSAMTEFLSS